MIKVIGLILLAELWGTVGQILYKKSAVSTAAPDLRDLKSYMSFVKEILLMPRIWLGLASVGMGLFVWLIALAHVDLSLAFPIDSMQYILALISSHFLLNEKMNKLKVSGTLLIICGIALVAMS